MIRRQILISEKAWKILKVEAVKRDRSVERLCGEILEKEAKKLAGGSS